KGDVQKGFELISGMPYAEARAMKDDKGEVLIQHPVACLDCHDPKTMAPRVTRPGFIAGIKALKAHQGVADFDPNRDATRQEMRSFVCGQCHVEYYFKGEGKVVTYPWANGVRVEEIEAYYDKEGFTDWVHAETGAKLLKAQHPEFEVWQQGVHSRAGVACADCHMPYQRVGALKVSDHWVRSPLLNINRACQTCHAVPEAELAGRVATIQDRHHALLQRAARANVDMLDAIARARTAGASDEALAAARTLHRQAQWRRGFWACGELHGLPRAPGTGPYSCRIHRLRPAGTARSGAGRHEAIGGRRSNAILDRRPLWIALRSLLDDDALAAPAGEQIPHPVAQGEAL